MTFPEGNVMSDYGGARQTMQTNPTVKQAFQNGGIAAGATSALRTTYRVLSRRKAAEEGVARLARVLTTLDLTALGVGSTLGVGVYVLAGDVAKNNAGPAVVLSFLIAAVASLFAGLCYAEFGARVPKAGSAYVYSYVCVGEFIAFIIGWNLILEYIIGAASVTKALSVYLDALVGKAISTKLLEWMPMDSPHLAKYPDVFAFAIVMLFSVALAFGVKESTKFNNFCTIINLCVVLFIIISGSFKADPKNWRIPPSQVPPRADGKTDGGGFMPYGMAGVIEGAAACFYGFIGFDCVATAGEEARSPQRSIPAAMVASLFIAFLAYFGVSSTLTLVLPYYMQDDEAPFPHMYSALGWDWAQYVVSVGAVCALCTSLLGAVFPLPRILFAMSCDGLVFRALAALSARGTPTRGTIVAGLFTGTLAMLFELKLLIHMMSIGTLMAYSMVAACVMLLRYECPAPHRALPPRSDGSDASAPLLAWRQLLRPEEGATPLSGSLVSALVTFYGAWAFVLIYCIEYLHYAWALVAAVPAVLALLAVHRQPQADKKLAFSVPLVPWLPGLSILINVHLMMNLDVSTWLRFCVWLGLGLIIYLTYGVWHSSERRTGATQQVPLAELHTDSHTALLDPLTHSLG